MMLLWKGYQITEEKKNNYVENVAHILWKFRVVLDYTQGTQSVKMNFFSCIGNENNFVNPKVNKMMTYLNYVKIESRVIIVHRLRWTFWERG